MNMDTIQSASAPKCSLTQWQDKPVSYFFMMSAVLRSTFAEMERHDNRRTALPRRIICRSLEPLHPLTHASLLEMALP